MELQSMKKVICSVVFLLTIFASCQDLGESLLPDCDPPGQIDPTIVMGESIARIRIGDTRCDVVRKLGLPTRTLDADLHGQMYLYEVLPLRYTTVTISDDPSFGLGVIGVHVEGTFAGVTSDGIGIRSEREFVVSRLGVPDTTFGQSPLIYDDYYFATTEFEFTYENLRVKRITMTTPRRFF